MSLGIGMSECCLSGKVGNGTPAGSVETIDGLQTYVSAPKDGSKAKSIVFITDIFGYEFKNIRLLADNYARAGFYAYIPDLFQGDALPLDFLQSVEPPLAQRSQLGMVDKAKNTATVASTFPPWLIAHREGVSLPLLQSFLRTIRSVEGTSALGTIGFCWGGRYAILMAKGELNGEANVAVDAAFAAHPSLVAVPADFEGLARPLGVAVGDKDGLLDNASVGLIQEALGRQTGHEHELRIYEDQVHGFALRGDWSSEKDRKAMDDVEKQGVEFFERFLK